MLGFLSKEKDSKAIVKKEDIFFVSSPDSLNESEIEVNMKNKALLFARKFNIDEVFLHIGGYTIKYEFKISL